MQMSSDDSEMEISSGEEEPEAVEPTTSTEIIGRCAAGKWSSKSPIFDPFSMQLLQDIRLGNDYVQSVQHCRILIISPVQLICSWSSSKNFIHNPKSFSNVLFYFQQSEPISHYSILHVTEIEQIPLAISHFKDAFCGSGDTLECTIWGN